MTILQENKLKVWPVIDYRELNEYIDAYTASADVCTQKLREWQQQGSNVALLALCRVYLQTHGDKFLWPFQRVKIKVHKYCLTHLEFELNMVLQIMWSIVVGQDQVINSTTSFYINDIFINNSVCLVACVKVHLKQFGLTRKDPEQLRNSAHMLGLYVSNGDVKVSFWKAHNILTCWSIFSLCRKLTGHLPVCG